MKPHLAPRVLGLCIAVAATWQIGHASAACKFSKGSLIYGANGSSATLIANGSVTVSTPAIYKTKLTVEVGIWVDADQAALDTDMPDLALTYYEHANCIFALGDNVATGLGVNDMSLRIAGNRIRYFKRTSPKIPGTNAYWDLQSHQDWADAIQALGVAAPKVNLLFTASNYVTIESMNPDGSIATWKTIGGASNGVGQGQALAAVDPNAYNNGGKPFNEDWWGVIAAHELGHALGVDVHVTQKFDTMCCPLPTDYSSEPGNTPSYQFSLSQGMWNKIVANNATSGDHDVDKYSSEPNPLTNEIWNFSQIHQFLIPYNFEDAILWKHTGVACSGSSCTSWQPLDNNLNTEAIAASDSQLYQLHTSGAIWRYTGVPCSGLTCTGWQKLDQNAGTRSIAAGGASLYSLHDDGAIWRYTGTPCTATSCPGWQKLDQNAGTRSIAAGDSLYQLHGDGEIWRYTGLPCTSTSCPGWQKLYDNVKARSIVAADANLYQLHDDGAIWHYTGTPCSGTTCPGWQKLDQNIHTTALAAAGSSLYQLHDDGALWRYTGTACGSTSCPGWQKIDQNAATVSIAATSTTVYQRHADGSLWRYTGTPCGSTSCPGWQQVDHNARTESITTGAALYQLHGN